MPDKLRRPLAVAEIQVTKEVLETTAGTLKEQAEILQGAAEQIEDVFPEGFTIEKGPPVNDSLPALIEFTQIVHARVKVAHAERMFGPSAKSKRANKKGK